MSYAYSELIGAQGKNLEILKAFLHSLGDAGGDEVTLNEYISNSVLQTELARQIVGGPWKLVNQPTVVEVDWESPFKTFLSSTWHISVDEHLTKQEMGKPPVSIFKPLYPEFLPTDPHTALSYELVPLPLRMSYSRLQDWMKRHAPVLAVDRELIAYVDRHVKCPCEIMALGSETESGCFPRFSRRRDTDKGSCSWWGIDSKKEDHAAFHGTIFILVRSTK